MRCMSLPPILSTIARCRQCDEAILEISAGEAAGRCAPQCACLFPPEQPARRNMAKVVPPSVLPSRWPGAPPFTPAGLARAIQGASLPRRGALFLCAASRSRDLLQLLQRAQRSRHRLVREARAPIGVGDLADINVAPRIQSEAMRGEKLAGLEPGAILAAEAGDQLALGVDDGEARAQVGRPKVDAHARPQLADHESRHLAAAAVEPARAVQVVPLRLILAI